MSDFTKQNSKFVLDEWIDISILNIGHILAILRPTKHVDFPYSSGIRRRSDTLLLAIHFPVKTAICYTDKGYQSNRSVGKIACTSIKVDTDKHPKRNSTSISS